MELGQKFQKFPRSCYNMSLGRNICFIYGNPGNGKTHFSLYLFRLMEGSRRISVDGLTYTVFSDFWKKNEFKCVYTLSNSDYFKDNKYKLVDEIKKEIIQSKKMVFVEGYTIIHILDELKEMFKDSYFFKVNDRKVYNSDDIIIGSNDDININELFVR
jgi:Cdc6-like AAA superfamily ATPase